MEDSISVTTFAAPSCSFKHRASALGEIPEATPKTFKRKPTAVFPVASLGTDADAGGSKHPAVADGLAKADPAHAVESVTILEPEDSVLDHSRTQAGVAEKEDSSPQSSSSRKAKTPVSDTPKGEDNYLLDSDGSETIFKPRLSKKINSMQRKKNREAKAEAARAIRNANPLPVKVSNAEGWWK